MNPSSRTDRIWELLGTLLGLVGCFVIAIQVATEYLSSGPSSLSFMYLIGFAIIYGFWAAYGWRYRRTAIWVGNAIGFLLQVLLFAVCLWKLHHQGEEAIVSDHRGWKMTIPLVICAPEDPVWEQRLKMLENTGATGVLLVAPDLYQRDLPPQSYFEQASQHIRGVIPMLEAHGYEVGVWIGHTLGHGGSGQGDRLVAGGNAYQPMVTSDYKEIPGCYCPLDPRFVEYWGRAMQAIAQSGAKLIVFDDDFRMHLHGGPFGCFCDLHLRRFNLETGRNLTREELVSQALNGKNLQVRKEWMDSNAGGLRHFAAALERAIHGVNPETRLGLCTGMTLWSTEGITPQEVLSTMNPKTRPWLRLSGAPYWVREAWGVSWVAEYTRMQRAWLGKYDAEVLGEGDTFPHTRFNTSATALKGFTECLIAAGLEHQLTYVISYIGPTDNETGYVSMMKKNHGRIAALRKFFPVQDRDVGLNVVRPMGTFSQIELPPGRPAIYWPDEPQELKMISRMGIPLAYGQPDGPVMLVGDSPVSLDRAELQPLLSRGALVDAIAAQHLMDKGFDCGIRKAELLPPPRFEHYTDHPLNGRRAKTDAWLINANDKAYYRFTPAEGAAVLTEYLLSEREKCADGALAYENAEGMRFVLLPMDIRFAQQHLPFLNYARQEQLQAAIAWLNRKPLACCEVGHPDMHVICRQSPDGRRVSVALHNAHQDSVENPVIRIPRNWQPEGSLEGLLPEAVAVGPIRFTATQDGDFANLKLAAHIPPGGILAIRLNEQSARPR